MGFMEEPCADRSPDYSFGSHGLLRLRYSQPRHARLDIKHDGNCCACIFFVLPYLGGDAIREDGRGPPFCKPGLQLCQPIQVYPVGKLAFILEGVGLLRNNLGECIERRANIGEPLLINKPANLVGGVSCSDLNQAGCW
jgi:hypothetical protein